MQSAIMQKWYALMGTAASGWSALGSDVGGATTLRLMVGTVEVVEVEAAVAAGAAAGEGTALEAEVVVDCAALECSLSVEASPP